ncbi:hypothetical protein JCM16303_003494 [Sporobolomyces ruberrimus]
MSPTTPRPPSSSSKPKNLSFPHLSSTETPTLRDVAKLLRDGTAKNVIVMTGAGISTGAGIPDFRSPGTGLYDNLAKYDLPYPEAIFDIDYLKERPEAFYTLAKELYPGNFKPTTTHYFLKLLQEKRVLKGVWTQNIDTLERIAGIEEEFIVEAHGSFASATCLKCSKPYTATSIKPTIMKGQVVRCQEPTCRQGRKNNLIKPDIVFFGEGLPEKFFEKLPDFKECDLLIVMGTSLSVGPFNTLLHRVSPRCPRVLINRELVGEATDPWDQGFKFSSDDEEWEEEEDGGIGREGGDRRDFFWQGESDRAVEELCRFVGEGWEEELKELRRRGWEALGGGGSSGREQEDVGEKKENVLEEVGKGVESEGGEKKERDGGVEELTKGVGKVDLDASKSTEKGSL